MKYLLSRIRIARLIFNIMKLGKIQRAWIKSLRKNPERQMKNFLGKGTPNDYKACCLGELLCVNARINKKKLPFGLDGVIRDGGNSFTLYNSFSKFGLRSELGDFKTKFRKGSIEYRSLAEMNDGGFTWLEIADFIESNPKEVFTKSV